MRTFETGATRDTEDDKPDLEAALSPMVLQRYAEYIMSHRKQPDGSIRKDDNWQKGMPLDSFMKSGWRHFHDWWLEHRGGESRDGIEDALCALIFNAHGYLFEILKEDEHEEALFIDFLDRFGPLPDRPPKPNGNHTA